MLSRFEDLRLLILKLLFFQTCFLEKGNTVLATTYDNDDIPVRQFNHQSINSNLNKLKIAGADDHGDHEDDEDKD